MRQDLAKGFAGFEHLIGAVTRLGDLRIFCLSRRHFLLRGIRVFHLNSLLPQTNSCNHAILTPFGTRSDTLFAHDRLVTDISTSTVNQWAGPIIISDWTTT
jgi:hypothetical protein